MIKAINLNQRNVNFRSQIIKVRETEDPPSSHKEDLETRILPSSLKMKTRQSWQKVESAFIDYPKQGLQGSVNSNFYQFLTMGIVPYLIGSGTFMFGFNCVNNLLDLYSKDAASRYGKKMALGVVLYGIMKTLSKQLVTAPVKMATGVDIDMPIENVLYPIPTEPADEADLTQVIEQRKVYDSKEFYRRDLLKREEHFDKIAKKIGLGDNLKDSISEAHPIIQNIVATAGAAKSISSYFWAAVGVGLAVQNSWDSFFDSITKRKRHISNDNLPFKQNLTNKVKIIGENAKNITRAFGLAFSNACESMWKGNLNTKSFYKKHWGKGLILSSAAVTVGMTANSILRAKNMAKNNNINSIDRTKESTVI